MRLKSLFAVIYFLFLVHSFSLAGTPKIDFSERVWDFGRVPQNVTVTHSFWIKNVGSDTLRDINVKTPCGCTKAPLKKTELAIGDSTELEISYNTGPSVSRERKYVEVSSNDIASGYNRLEITAEVKPRPDTMLSLTYSPYILEFKEDDKGKLKEQEIEFSNIGEEEYKLEISDYPEELFEVKLSNKSLKSGKKIVLKVKPVKNFPSGTVKKSVTLSLRGEKEFRITVPLKKETLSTAKGK